MRVDIHGTLGERTGAKDVTLRVTGTTGDDAARYAAVEFTGPTVKAFPMNERFVLCNMTTEMGAKVGMIEADPVTKDYLAHTGHRFEPIRSDDDATFVKTFAFDVDGMGRKVAGPSNPANLKPVEDVEGTKIDVAFLGSCTNARIEDLRIAAELLRGEKVAPGVRFQITPASQIIYRQALKEGLVEVFMDAGATFTSSTCGPCFGGHMGTLAGDEVCISSTNRNYPGRMGSPTAQVYLANSFARIFFRTAINLGSPVVECAGLRDRVKSGDVIELDLAAGEVRIPSGGMFKFTPLPPNMLEILEAGGLVPKLRKELQTRP